MRFVGELTSYKNVHNHLFRKGIKTCQKNGFFESLNQGQLTGFVDPLGNFCPHLYGTFFLLISCQKKNFFHFSWNQNSFNISTEKWPKSDRNWPKTDEKWSKNVNRRKDHAGVHSFIQWFDVKIKGAHVTAKKKIGSETYA